VDPAPRGEDEDGGAGGRLCVFEPGPGEIVERPFARGEVGGLFQNEPGAADDPRLLDGARREGLREADRGGRGRRRRLDRRRDAERVRRPEARPAESGAHHDEPEPGAPRPVLPLDEEPSQGGNVQRRRGEAAEVLSVDRVPLPRALEAGEDLGRRGRPSGGSAERHLERTEIGRRHRVGHRLPDLRAERLLETGEILEPRRGRLLPLRLEDGEHLACREAGPRTGLAFSPARDGEGGVPREQRRRKRAELRVSLGAVDDRTGGVGDFLPQARRSRGLALAAGIARHDRDRRFGALGGAGPAAAARPGIERDEERPQAGGGNERDLVETGDDAFEGDAERLPFRGIGKTLLCKRRPRLPEDRRVEPARPRPLESLVGALRDRLERATEPPDRRGPGFGLGRGEARRRLEEIDRPRGDGGDRGVGTGRPAAAARRAALGIEHGDRLGDGGRREERRGEGGDRPEREVGIGGGRHRIAPEERFGVLSPEAGDIVVGRAELPEAAHREGRRPLDERDRRRSGTSRHRHDRAFRLGNVAADPLEERLPARREGDPTGNLDRLRLLRARHGDRGHVSPARPREGGPRGVEESGPAGAEEQSPSRLFRGAEFVGNRRPDEYGPVRVEPARDTAPRLVEEDPLRGGRGLDEIGGRP
jgi:hypothetical protein